VSLPQAIVSGANGAGKTSILESFYFVVDGKKSDGSVVGGEIYTQFAKTKGELIAEVELEINDTTKFMRRCEGSEKRAKGSPISELVRNINTTLFIEKDGKRDVVTQKDWNEQISVYFPENYRYFTNPNFLEQQKQADVKDFVFGLLDLSEFDTKNKDIAKSKVNETKAEINKLDILLQDHAKIQEPTKVDDLTESFSEQIAELREKINVPLLSQADVLHNAKIEKQLAEIKATEPKIQELEVEKEYPVLQGKSLLPLQDVSEIVREIEKLKNKELDDVASLNNLIFAKANNTRKKQLQNKIKNYDKIKSGLKCTICPICTDLFCEKRCVDIESLENLQEQNEQIEFVNIENLKTQIEAEKVEFETNRKNQIAGLEAELQEIQKSNSEIEKQNEQIRAENERATTSHNEKIAEINKKNEQIIAGNEKIKAENEQVKADFETKKAKQITELRAKIKYPKKVDNSEIESEIAKLETQKEDNRQLFLTFTKLQAVYDNAQSEVARLTEEKNALLEKLVDAEQEFITEKNKELKFYQTIENQINSELADFGVKFKLYRKLISADDYKADFSIILNDRIFNSNGESFIQKINLCNFFQQRKEITLPIWCDETTVLDEFNTQDLITLFDNEKNIIILEKTDEELRIINF